MCQLFSSNMHFYEISFGKMPFPPIKIPKLRNKENAVEPNWKSVSAHVLASKGECPLKMFKQGYDAFVGGKQIHRLLANFGALQRIIYTVFLQLIEKRG